MFFTWPFLFLPVAATCGWLAGRRSLQSTSSNISSQVRQNYFKGLNYLINEQPDKAVDVFIKLLEVDSDTVETHLALGSLFRQRGEVDRAIRVHQNLIARPQLDKRDRLHALSELGQDYLRAGVLDRAERLFLELIESGEERVASLRFLLNIYQQEKDWKQAIDIAERLQALGESMRIPIAQFECELAEQMVDRGYVDQALAHLKKAQMVDQTCVRASLIQGKIESDEGRYQEAIRCYQRAIAQDQDYISEVVQPLVRCYQIQDNEVGLIAYLQECLECYPRVSLVLAISEYLQRKEGDRAAIEFIAKQIQFHPSLRGLNRLVELYVSHSSGETKEKLLILKKFIEKMLADKPTYRCNHCGFSGKTLYWSCPSCHHWNAVRPIRGLEGV